MKREKKLREEEEEDGGGGVDEIVSAAWKQLAKPQKVCFELQEETAFTQDTFK